MTTPRGCLKSVTTAFKRLARDGDVEGLRAYLRSDAFLTAFGGLDPERRQSAMRSYATAEALCEAKAPHRLVKPKRIDAKRSQKASWSDPIMRAKLANAYVRAGGDDEKAARILGLTVGSARLAKRRHLDAPATDHRQKASSAAMDCTVRNTRHVPGREVLQAARLSRSGVPVAERGRKSKGLRRHFTRFPIGFRSKLSIRGP